MKRTEAIVLAPRRERALLVSCEGPLVWAPKRELVALDGNRTLIRRDGAVVLELRVIA
jgi:hypothetical protein